MLTQSCDCRAGLKTPIGTTDTKGWACEVDCWPEAWTAGTETWTDLQVVTRAPNWLSAAGRIGNEQTEEWSARPMGPEENCLDELAVDWLYYKKIRNGDNELQ